MRDDTLVPLVPTSATSSSSAQRPPYYDRLADDDDSDIKGTHAEAQAGASTLSSRPWSSDADLLERASAASADRHDEDEQWEQVRLTSHSIAEVRLRAR